MSNGRRPVRFCSSQSRRSTYILDASPISNRLLRCMWDHRSRNTNSLSFKRAPDHFSVCQPKLSPLWLASLLLLCGDVETNPGPPKSKSNQDSTNNKQIWNCSICNKTITRNQISFQCHNTNHWIHKKCSKITEKDYHIDWTCSLHSCNQCNITAIQPSINQHSSTLANSNFSQQFTTGQPTTSTQVTYHSKVKELENKRSKTTAKSKSESTHMKQIWSCSICNKTITHNQISFLCHRSLTNFSDTDHWVHKKCANITERNHHDTWTCQLHSNNQNNMTSNQSTLNQQSSTLTSSNINQQFKTGQPTTSTQVKYHSKIKEMENKRNKTKPHSTKKANSVIQTNSKSSSKNNHKPKNQALKIYQLNVNGIQNSLAELKQELKEQNIDIALIQETKLHPDAKDPIIPDYTTYRLDRPIKDKDDKTKKTRKITVNKTKNKRTLKSPKKTTKKSKINGGGLIIFIKMIFLSLQ